jgi:hypothetical protein
MSKEKGEVYYITPNGKKLRTRHEIQTHLHDDLTINNFTLVKEAIGAGPDDEIIRPAKYYNYARRSNVDPVISDTSQQPLLGKRIPKPKMRFGSSPPPPSISNNNNNNNISSSNTNNRSLSPYQSTNKSLSRDNSQDASKIGSSKKQSSTIKSKLK